MFSRFALNRTEQDRLNQLTNEAALAGIDENDPKRIARWMKRMVGEFAEEADWDFEDLIGRIEQEQSARLAAEEEP